MWSTFHEKIYLFRIEFVSNIIFLREINYFLTISDSDEDEAPAKNPAVKVAEAKKKDEESSSDEEDSDDDEDEKKSVPVAKKAAPAKEESSDDDVSGNFSIKKIIFFTWNHV